MCGIAGFCNMPYNWHENITRMNNRMYHRGPDAQGSWASENADIVLGHRRLSILDLSMAGSQPMVSKSGRYIIALNGEIYNYRELAERLKRENIIKIFRSSSDTEVLLETCEAYGIKKALCMAKGMFAIALYDIKEQTLYLARDRMGEKPLYYGLLEKGFVFASDISAIQENINFHEKIDQNALALYFRFGYIPAPYSIYENVKKLEPGSILTLHFPFIKVDIQKYWDIMQIAQEGQENLFQGTEEEAVDYLDDLLKKSIKDQMVADVPVGAFLSGGVDSTVVVAIMQQLSRKKIKTFTIGLKEQSYNEAEFARKTAEYLGTEHTELYISDKDAQLVIPKLSSIYGEPFADSSQIPTYLVSKLAKESVTVSLSGDGGDELFAGYNSYRMVENIWGIIHYLPYSVRKRVSQWIEIGNVSSLKKIAQLLPAESAEDLYRLMIISKGVERKLFERKDMPEYYYSKYPSSFLKGTVNNIMLMDMLMYHPDDILTKVDRAGMSVSLESRIPMLDRDIVEYAWRLPLKYKKNGKFGKKILKEVLYRYIPKEMMERPKKGFSIPLGQWIRNGELREWAEELIKGDSFKNQEIFMEKQVKRIWDDFIKTGEGEEEIWFMLMFAAWIQTK